MSVICNGLAFPSRQESHFNFCFLASWYEYKSNPFYSFTQKSFENLFLLFITTLCNIICTQYVWLLSAFFLLRLSPIPFEILHSFRSILTSFLGRLFVPLPSNLTHSLGCFYFFLSCNPILRLILLAKFTFISDLFNDAVSSSVYITSNNTINE
jgi:hypothetical protein